MPSSIINLRQAVCTGDEIAVGVCRQQRNVVEIAVREVDAKNFSCLRLDNGPGRHAADEDVVICRKQNAISTRRAVLDQLTGGKCTGD